MARSLSKRTRFQVLRRDGYTCRYCGRKPPEVTLEVDHVHPVAAGGTDHPSNLVAACKDCNRGKGAQAQGASAYDHARGHGLPAEPKLVTCHYCGNRITDFRAAQLALFTQAEGAVVPPGAYGVWHSVHDTCHAERYPGIIGGPYWVDLADFTNRAEAQRTNQHIRQKTWADRTNWASWMSALVDRRGSRAA